MTKIKPFINKYNWKKITFLSKKDVWEKIEKNNLTISLNVVFEKRKNISCLCLKHNSDREKQVILLMIPNGDRWYYLAVKKLSALLKGIKSKHKGDFYCLN